MPGNVVSYEAMWGNIGGNYRFTRRRRYDEG